MNPSHSADRNVEGILHYMQRYFAAREQQVLRINPGLQGILQDMVWLHMEILRKVLHKTKSFSGEKYRVADILAGADDMKRRSLFSTGGEQNSIMDDIVERSDETGKASDQSIHDMRTLFRSIDSSLENVVQLIQHWMKWDLPDAADLHTFDEQIRRLSTLRSIQLNDDVRERYRVALGKPKEDSATDEEILTMELKRLDQVATRFSLRRQEDEPYQMIICRDGCDKLPADTPNAPGTGSDDPAASKPGEPYDYKMRQCETLARRAAEEHQAVEQKLGQEMAPS